MKTDRKFDVYFLVTVLLLLGFGLVMVMFITPFFSTLLVAGSIFFAYLLIKRMNIEFEYIVTGDSIDFDKITGKTKRKRIFSTSIRNFSNFGEYNANLPATSGKLVNMSISMSNGAYFADFADPKMGLVRVVFSPNEKTLKNMKPYLKNHY